MSLLSRFRKWLASDRVQQTWNERGKTMTRVRFEYSNGSAAELTGEAADEWWKDLHYRNCGRPVDWKRHKFNWLKTDKQIPMCEISIHDFVVWISSDGVVQWVESRRVVHLEFANGEWWAFCDGSMTGIKASELQKR